MQKRKRYSKEFKLEAVRLLARGEKPAAEIARELGIARNQLCKWQERVSAKGEAAFPGSGRQEGLEAENAGLCRELEQLREERDILKKGGHLLRQGVRVRHQFIEAHRQEFRAGALCRALGVSRSGYYDWRYGAPSRRAQANGRLLAKIRTVHAAARENYGADKTWRALCAQGERCGRHRVARMRRLHSIVAKRLRRFRRSCAARNSLAPAPELLGRDFSACGPDRVWVSDITFVPTRRGWLYVAVMIDLFSRRIVGWAMSQRVDQQLTVDALQMAIRQRRAAPGLIHHSDQGQQYAGIVYRQMLKANGMVQSMSRKGNCLDNAVAESFFSTLKNELVHHTAFADRDEARSAIFDYMEVFYNRQRIHESLEFLTPVEYETLADVA